MRDGRAGSYLNKVIRYDLFKMTLLFKSIPQLPTAQANYLLHNWPGSPEASHPYLEQLQGSGFHISHNCAAAV